MDSQQRRMYTTRELEAAKVLATFHLAGVEFVGDVAIVYCPVKSQVQQPVNAAKPGPPAENPALGTNHQPQPVTRPSLLSSTPFLNTNPTSVLSGTSHGTSAISQAQIPYRYSCYQCDYVSQRVGCIVNHMTKKHSMEKALVDRVRIRASAVQMLW
ncbi:hypothetical protein AYL99_00046 [Fonsecaea erecta]|uniref:Uncharacterized protein n=1 Tax=Fonsecaea erecta TaxID=1367422 RepID=A0A178ZWD7_9EURO|nr:hypothetical protein AYL99_00046 [Fonsecaea erecta]OAP64074.1 hypothetical protein AYL99_00046 [Fonsecaea erecta]